MIPEQDAPMIEHGIRSQGLVLTGEWKCALNFLAAIADAQIRHLRLLDTTQLDQELISRLFVEWRSTEAIINALQNHVLGAIEDRNNYVKEILQGKVPEETIEQIMNMPFRENTA